MQLVSQHLQDLEIKAGGRCLGESIQDLYMGWCIVARQAVSQNQMLAYILGGNQQISHAIGPRRCPAMLGPSSCVWQCILKKYFTQWATIVSMSAFRIPYLRCGRMLCALGTDTVQCPAMAGPLRDMVVGYSTCDKGAAEIGGRVQFHVLLAFAAMCKCPNSRDQDDGRFLVYSRRCVRGQISNRARGRVENMDMPSCKFVSRVNSMRSGTILAL